MTGSLEKNPASTQELDYLELIGEEPRQWLEKLRSEKISRLRDAIGHAMEFLWQRNLSEGCRMLGEVEAAVPEVALDSPSIAHLLARHCYAARAYAHYLAGNLEAAKLDLQRAHAEMTALLSMHSFLIPLAPHFLDFLTQQTRIARRENRWQDAKGHLDNIRGIYADEEPFCVLHSGREIRLTDVRAFFRSLHLTDQQRERVTKLLGDNVSLEEKMDFIEGVIFTLPDLVIPYP